MIAHVNHTRTNVSVKKLNRKYKNRRLISSRKRLTRQTLLTSPKLSSYLPNLINTDCSMFNINFLEFRNNFPNKLRISLKLNHTGCTITSVPNPAESSRTLTIHSLLKYDINFLNIKAIIWARKKYEYKKSKQFYRLIYKAKNSMYRQLMREVTESRLFCNESYSGLNQPFLSNPICLNFHPSTSFMKAKRLGKKFSSTLFRHNLLLSASIFRYRTSSSSLKPRREPLLETIMLKSEPLKYRDIMWKSKNFFYTRRRLVLKRYKKLVRVLRMRHLKFSRRYRHKFSRTITLKRQVLTFKAHSSTLTHSMVTTSTNLIKVVNTNNFQHKFTSPTPTKTPLLAWNSTIFNNIVSSPKLRSFFKSSQLVSPVNKTNVTTQQLSTNFKFINITLTNLVPSFPLSLGNFRKSLSKKQSSVFQKSIGSWVNLTGVKFLEQVAGSRCYVRMNSKISRIVQPNFKMLYYKWAARLKYYSRRLGHRFFLMEALYIIHISLYFRDSKIIISWLKSMIHRISFWKTRVIFRFIRYVFTYLFEEFLPHLKAKGFKVKLKGKISAAGNSRKRSIMFRFGKCSYSAVDVKCLYSNETVKTFTGVQGLQLWVFY